MGVTICAQERLLSQEYLPFKSETMQFLNVSVLSIFSILFTLTIGRPRIETINSSNSMSSSRSKSNSMSNSISNSLQVDASITKKPLSACEEAVASCCSSQWSTFQQTADALSSTTALASTSSPIHALNSQKS